MDRVFPLGFPFPTAFYLTLYVLTLILHVIFMNYVLAGTGYLAVVGVDRWLKRRLGREPKADMVFDILRDWMPFMLGAAITAGVAPLLFVQILYKENFYTANLLLFHRWMAILPVLIVGFYMLYLLKSTWLGRHASWLAAVVGLVAFACFVFTGFSWTENHLLSLDRAIWPSHYESGAMVYRSSLIVPRFLMWAAGSVVTMATIVGWQILGGAGREESHAETRRSQRSEADGAAVRRIAVLAMVGLVVSFVASSAYLWLQGKSGAGRQSATAFLSDALVRPYALLAVVGGILQLLCWRYLLRNGWVTTSALATASLGLAATLLGMTVVREAVRLHAIDITQLYDQHAKAAQVGGWWVFAFFLVVNAGLIAWCVRLARSGSTAGGSPTKE